MLEEIRNSCFSKRNFAKTVVAAGSSLRWQRVWRA